MQREAVREIMTVDVAAVVPGTPVGDAERVCARRGVRHLVVMKAGDLVGVLCTCDLEDHAGTETVEGVMSAPVVTIGADETLAAAAAKMRRGQLGCLPVVEDGEIVGILSRHDLEAAGFPIERRRCAACGSRRHIRRDPERGSVSFCVECLKRADDSSDVSGEGGEEE